MKKILGVLSLGIFIVGCSEVGSGTNQPANNNSELNDSLQQSNIQGVTQLTYESAASSTPDFFQKQLIAKRINKGFEDQSLTFIHNINNITDQFGFDPNKIAINAEKLNIQQIKPYAIRYTTPAVSAAFINTPTRQVSGLVLVPQMDLNQIKGIVLYYHGTELAKNAVPSCRVKGVKNLPEYCKLGDANLANEYSYYEDLAGVFAAAGYVVVAPDYLGMGIDNQNLHPYVIYAKENALSGLNMLEKTRKLLVANNTVTESQQLNLYITGYSEGGGYALKAAQLAQQQEVAKYLDKQKMILKAAAPAQGVYDMNTQIEFAKADLKDGIFNGEIASTDNMMMPDQSGLSEAVLNMNEWKIVSSVTATLAKPMLSALVSNTLAYYATPVGGDSAATYDQVMYPNFWRSIQLSPQLAVNLNELFSSQNYSSEIITGALVKHSFGFTNPDNNNRYFAEPRDITIKMFDVLPSELSNLSSDGLPIKGVPAANNSILAFSDLKFFDKEPFASIISQANTYQWTSAVPINFIHLAYDSYVAVKNTEIAYSHMKSLAPNLIESKVIQNFPLTNSLAQLSSNSPVAISKFWMKLNPLLTNGNDVLGNLTVPIDHSEAMSYAHIAALCIFEKSSAESPKLCKE